MSKQHILGIFQGRARETLPFPVEIGFLGESNQFCQGIWVRMMLQYTSPIYFIRIPMTPYKTILELETGAKSELGVQFAEVLDDYINYDIPRQMGLLELSHRSCVAETIFETNIFLKRLQELHGDDPYDAYFELEVLFRDTDFYDIRLSEIESAVQKRFNVFAGFFITTSLERISPGFKKYYSLRR